MALRKQQQTRRRNQRAKSELQRQAYIAANDDRQNDNRVLTFQQWCALNAFSPATGRRIIAADNGPTIIQLSPRRIGIRIGDNRAWQESRARGNDTAA